MRDFATKSLVLLFAVLCLSATHMAIAQEPPMEAPPADVAGKWTVYARAANGETSTKYLEIKQDGNTLSGHFKGPNQSGGIEGTINEQHIVVRTKTRWVFVFRGRVEGNSIQGTFHDRRGTGEWQAVRSN
ncbi:MAG TPA: hypothetical protein VLT90_03805 [Terriglobales bacterium]|nr:hypothetical protein [Terriglobales bacterium]HUM04560.1 hypothetical protein [Terriglobales bacterium]